ncbi:MAG: TonB-dependent receptor, partial [Bacteroidales bacterium]|nr:TonB-dependent receptor [Bacteroidales bacterium]
DNISTDILSFFKIRGSYGKNGNINVLNGYPYAAVMNMNQHWYQYTEDGIRSWGSVPNGLPNPDLEWENSKQINIGFDARFLNSRLSLSFEWYKKTTDGLLVTVTPVIETGVGTTVKNAGDVENKGIEVELGWKDKVFGDLHYSVNANLATLHNELTDLDPTVPYIAGRGIQGSPLNTRCAVGETLWAMYGYKTEGVDPVTGEIIYTDVDGNKERGNDGDITCLGSGLPKVTYGLTLNLEYKGIDLTVFGNGVSGNKIVPAAWRADRKYCNNYSYFYYNSWFPNSTKARFPRVDKWDEKAYGSDLTVFDGSYFKIKQIQLGYTLPKNIVSKAFMSSLRAYVSLENFFTFTDYIGLDPETASANSGNGLGFDFGTYPTAKQVIFGVNVTF